MNGISNALIRKTVGFAKENNEFLRKLNIPNFEKEAVSNVVSKKSVKNSLENLANYNMALVKRNFAQTTSCNHKRHIVK